MLGSRLAVLLLGLGPWLASGCALAPTDDPHCDELLPVHTERLADFVAADAEATVQWLSPDVIDAGGGSDGEGSVPVELFSQEFWQDIFNSPDFLRDVAGREPGELFDLDATVIHDRASYVDEVGNDRVGVYRLFDDDCVASTPPRPEAAITGAWFGIYRKSFERWWVVAID